MELSNDPKSPPVAEEQASKWMLHVDGASNANNGGAGILIQGPKGVEIEVAARLSFPMTYNEAEYEALILGLEHAILELENNKKDALSKFGAAMDGIRDRKITALVRERSSLAKKAESQIPSHPIYHAIRSALQTNGGWAPLKCLDEERALYVMREIPEGSCGNHSGARSPAQKIVRQRFYWPTLAKDSKELVKKCESCQRYASLIHQPATPMEPIKIACPFDQWGIDIVGAFLPAQAQKKFIIVAVEYFTKWVEAEAVAQISKKEVISFIWKNIICRFGLPRILISDNGTQFQGRKITEWCKELKIAQHFTAVANP
ncbi:UNVERIFIED_CONTAM: Gag-Pol polyprotein [Sesamum indicum]